ncbi:MAG: hypothetical protein KFH87_12605 [Bacteroidetes bacterium]|nr:hypothetical protein [Bacteroidota bacterium]
MARRLDNATARLLSLYLDGALDDVRREAFEQRIAEDAELQEAYTEMRALRDRLSAHPPLPANHALADRIMQSVHTIDDQPDPILPLPRRFHPAAAAVAMVMIITVMGYAWLQRESILRYVSDTGSQVQYTYEETILKGWIMPLFQKTGRDDVLQFAMFGTLPLDREEGTILQVDESTDLGYRLELSGGSSPKLPAATVDELYEEIQPTDKQRLTFDTLFHYAQQQLESAVLMNEEREIAINPAISRFHTMILSGIAEQLDARQIVRFEHYLERRNTPYTIAAVHVPHVPSPFKTPRSFTERFRSIRTPDEFVVLHDDSVTIMRLQLNMDSLRNMMHAFERSIPRIEVHLKQFARKFEVRGLFESRKKEQKERAVEERSRQSRSPRGVTISPIQPGDSVRGISITIDAETEIMREIEKGLEEMRREIRIFRRGDTGRIHLEKRRIDSLLRSLGIDSSRTPIPIIVPPAPPRFRLHPPPPPLEPPPGATDSTVLL